MPDVGYIRQLPQVRRVRTPFFGLFHLPMIVEKNDALATQLVAALIAGWVGLAILIRSGPRRPRALHHSFNPHANDVLKNRMLPRAMGWGSDAVGSQGKIMPPATSWPRRTGSR
jgi:hypothetical protein